MNLNAKISLIHRAVWEGIVARPDNEFLSTDQWLQVTSPGRPASHMNGVYRCERDDLDEEAVHKLVVEIIQHYEERKLNFRWKISDATRPRALGKVLVKNGMVLKDLLYGFCVEPSEMDHTSCDGFIEVFPLTSDRFEDWLVVQAKGWNVPSQGIEYLRKNSAEMMSGSSKTKHFIAYWNDEPAGAASFLALTGYALMIGGAVIEDFRGRGLYRALINARFDVLKTMGLPAVFHCVSNTSAPVCIKLGFKKLCEIESYELPLSTS